MNQRYGIIIIYGIFTLYFVRTNEIPMYNIQNAGGHNHLSSYPVLNLEHTNKPLCFENNKFVECTSKDFENSEHLNKNYNSVKEKAFHRHNMNRINSLIADVQPLLRRIFMTRPTSALNMNPLHGRIHQNNMLYPMQGGYTTSNFGTVPTFKMLINNNHPYSLPPLHATPGFTSPFNSMASFTHTNHNLLIPTVALSVTEPTLPYQMLSAYEKFARSLDYFERKFYKVTFNKLTSISPQERRANGMSFVQSGFFLQLTLMALSLEADSRTKVEIDKTIGFRVSDMETLGIIKELITSLPESSEKLKLRRASRLMLWPGREVSSKFRSGAASALQLNIDTFNGTEKQDQITTILNQKIEADSGGAIRDTFDEDDLSGGITAVLTTTLYFRARWRASPTVLNGTLPFRDGDEAHKRSVRMIRLNDVMGYADIREWNAEALEIQYATPDLSLVVLVPRTTSLTTLAEQVTTVSVRNITSRMKRMRVAAILPLYTLRMTLLLPNKLQTMGVNRLFEVNNMKAGDPIRLSHMVQRLMFWAEAGRNAYKDDGLEWDETPEMQLLVDRPYIFFVRWRNLTLLNGNFVL